MKVVLQGYVTFHDKTNHITLTIIFELRRPLQYYLTAAAVFLLAVMMLGGY